MRWFSLSLFVLSACTPVVPPGDALAPTEVELQPETVLLDDVPGIEDVVVEYDTVTLWTDGRELPMITEGSVLVGERWGVMRRVNTVTVEGRRILMTTRAAKLTDAVARGSVRTQLALGTDRSEPMVLDLGGRVLFDEMVFSESEQGLVQVTVATTDTSSLVFEPQVDYGIDIGLTSVAADFEARFTLDTELGLVATVDGELDDALDMVLSERDAEFRFDMGPVPVWGQAHVRVRAIVDADFEAGATASIEHQSRAWLEATAHFSDAWGEDNRIWETALDAGLDGYDNGDWLRFDNGYGGAGKARVRIVADVSFDMYDSAGATFHVEPWSDLDVCDNGTDLTLGGGVVGTHAYYFEALGWSLVDSEAMPFDFGPWTVLECPQ